MDIFLIKKREFEIKFNIVAIVILTGGIASILSLGGDRSEGNIIFQILVLVFTLPGIYILIRNNNLDRIIVSGNIWLTILVFYCILSSLWSIDFILSLRRALSLLIVYLYCIYLVSRYRADDLITIISHSLCIIILLNILAVLFFGGIHAEGEHDGAWNGFTGHKNNLGRFASIGVILFFGLRCFYKKKIYSIYLIVSFIVLIMTTSKTSLAACLVAILFFYLVIYLVTGKFLFFHHPKNVRILLFIIAIIVSLLLVTFVLPVVFELLDRDFTFSGRDKIWTYALMLVEGINYFGSGYKAFWIEALTWDFFYYNPYWGPGKVTGNGHNGYLDIYLELGILGLLMFVIIIFLHIKQIIIGLLSEKVNVILFVSAPFLIFNMLYNVVETNFLSNRLDLLWFVFLICFLHSNKRVHNELG